MIIETPEEKARTKYQKVLKENAPDILALAPSYSKEELKQKLAEAALLVSSYTKAQREDQDLASLKEKVKDASVTYSSGIKVNKAKIELFKDTLISIGAYVDEITLD